MTHENDTAKFNESDIAQSATSISPVVTEIDETRLIDPASSRVGESGQGLAERRNRVKFPEFDSKDESFPWNELPETIRGAVIEICTNDKVAVPIAVQAALSAVSLSCQDLIWIDRGIGEKSVCSLYMLAVADTGARKSRADAAVTSAIEDYDRSKRDEYSAKSKVEEYSSKERRKRLANTP